VIYLTVPKHKKSKQIWQVSIEQAIDFKFNIPLFVHLFLGLGLTNILSYCIAQ